MLSLIAYQNLGRQELLVWQQFVTQECNMGTHLISTRAPTCNVVIPFPSAGCEP